MSDREENLRAQLRDDPGHHDFAVLAELLIQEGRLLEALEACLRGLSANPSFHQGRLMLSRIYYELDCHPFAAREIALLCRSYPHSESLKKLLNKFGPIAGIDETAVAVPAQQSDGAPAEVVAETDFEISDIDLIEEDLRK